MLSHTLQIRIQTTKARVFRLWSRIWHSRVCARKWNTKMPAHSLCN